MGFNSGFKGFTDYQTRPKQVYQGLTYDDDDDDDDDDDEQI